MKALLLNQTFYPDVAATAQYVGDLAAGLAESGHEVTVVAGRRAYDSPEQKFARQEVWKGVQIRRIASTGLGKGAWWRRAVDFGTFQLSCLVRLLLLPKFDVVVAMTSPPLIAWLATMFVRVKGGRLVFWVMDLNPDQAVAAGWLKDDSILARGLNLLLIESLRRSERIVVLDRYMARRVMNKGIPESKIHVLPPWSHESEVRYTAQGREEFRARHGLSGKFVVMYSGNHSPCHPLDTLLEAAERLAGREEIAFCFAGGGSEFRKVQEFAGSRKLANIVTVPYQPLNQLSASLSAADLHVVVMGDPFVGIVHPCKVYNIRSLGLPFLYIGPSSSPVTDLGPAFKAANGDVDAVTRSILHASARQPVASRLAHTDFSQQTLVAQMVRLVESAGGLDRLAMVAGHA